MRSVISTGALLNSPQPGHAVILKGSTDDNTCMGVQQEQQELHLAVKMPFKSDDIAVCNQTPDKRASAFCFMYDLIFSTMRT
jgi:hypothetical protein